MLFFTLKRQLRNDINIETPLITIIYQSILRNGFIYA